MLMRLQWIDQTEPPRRVLCLRLLRSRLAVVRLRRLVLCPGTLLLAGAQTGITDATGDPQVRELVIATGNLLLTDEMLTFRIVCIWTGTRPTFA